MRRATGIPAASKRMSHYEDSEIGPPHSVPYRSRKSTSPMNLMSVRELKEGSPVPSPYQSKNQLSMSMSTGDESDQVRFNSGSLISSSNSSLNQISDVECDTYESVSDFLKYPASVPSSATAAQDMDNGRNILHSSFNAPSYPAPIPPKKSREIKKVKAIEKEVSKDGQEDGKGKMCSDDEDEDDGYEKVLLGDGRQVEIVQSYDDVERAQLPLVSSPSTRSPLTGDSSHSSPQRAGEFLRSTSGFSEGSKSLSTSPLENKTSLNEGASRYIAHVKSGHAQFPPEPISPPPPPPTGSVAESMTPSVPAIVKSSSFANTLTTAVKEEVEEEQPKLPPKKRSRAQLASQQESNNSPDPLLSSSLKPVSLLSSGTPTMGNSFDKFKAQTLDDSELSSQPLKVLPVTASASVPTNSFFPEEDDESLGSLEPPRIPRKSESNILKPILSSQSFNYPPVTKRRSTVSQFGCPLLKGVPPAIPKRPVASLVNKFQDEEDVYSFDSLNAKKPKQPSLRQKDIPEVAAGGGERPYKDLYSFDHLDSRLALGIEAETGTSSRGTLSPETGQARKHDTMEGELVQPPAPFSPTRPPPVTDDGGGAVEEKLHVLLPVLPPKGSPPLVQRRMKRVSSL